MRTGIAVCLSAVLSVAIGLGACGDSANEGGSEADSGAEDVTVVDSPSSSDALTADTSPTNDAGPEDATVTDAADAHDATDAADAMDASDGADSTADADAGDAATPKWEAGAEPDASYNDLTDTTKWSAFDMTTANSGSSGFWGGTFDGRYVYFTPSHNATSWDGLVTRYDTQADFSTKTSYSTFDTTTVNSKLTGYYGAAFDGRYVYFIPPASNGSGIGAFVARYDTQASFSTTGSWSVFDVTSVNTAAKGFLGAVFDGRYLYLVPYYNAMGSDGGYSGVVARFDTTATFTSKTSWEAFDATTVNAKSDAFYGGVFDGRYVYFVPDHNGQSGLVTRYDTQGTFGSTGSWSTYDITTINANAKGYQTGAFDGRYLYLVPNHNANGAHGLVARYDTTATFAQAGSWELFDATTVSSSAKGFFGATFDGRFVYFAPTYNSLVLAFDTRATFGSTSSWKVLDLSGVMTKPSGFQGAVFDGQYVYLVPYWTGGSYSGNVARFAAKSPPHMPSLPGWNGSFF